MLTDLMPSLFFLLGKHFPAAVSGMGVEPGVTAVACEGWDD